jgi:integrase
MAHKFTKSFLQRALYDEPPARDTIYTDSQLPRFLLRLQPTRDPNRPWSATWCIRVPSGVGRTSKLRIGDARTLDVDKARDLARKRLAAIDAGEPIHANVIWTVRDLWRNFQASSNHQNCMPKTQQNRSFFFQKYILPRIGLLPLPQINRSVGKQLYDSVLAIAKARRYNGIDYNGLATARSAIYALQAVLSWAVEVGQLTQNPLHNAMRMPGSPARETVITKPEQYAKLFQTMNDMVVAGTLRPNMRTFFTVAALTGMRRGELRTLTWSQVNLAERHITLTNTKGIKLSRDGSKSESVSLPPIAAASLATIMPDNPSPAALVFQPAYRGGRPHSSNKLISYYVDWKRVRDATGLPKDMVLHSLRHSLGTVSVIAGMSALETQKLLRHRTLKMTSRYVHLAEGAESRLQDRATAHLFEPEKPPATVVPLRRGPRKAG